MEKYIEKDMFKSKYVEPQEEVALVEVKKDKWYKRIGNFFRKIFT